MSPTTEEQGKCVTSYSAKIICMIFTSNVKATMDVLKRRRCLKTAGEASDLCSWKGSDAALSTSYDKHNYLI